jgi:hypothetical protein
LREGLNLQNFLYSTIDRELVPVFWLIRFRKKIIVSNNYSGSQKGNLMPRTSQKIHASDTRSYDRIGVEGTFTPTGERKVKDQYNQTRAKRR